MFRRRLKLEVKAQTVLEYTALIGIVTVVLMTLQPMIKRAIQGTVKTVADQVGNQEGSEQDFNESFTNYSNTQVHVLARKNIHEYTGNITYSYNDVTTTNTDTLTDMGVQ
ncbi:MAG: hypothetical protein HQL24_09640 [Candidatus Omnitrophica bacterium]|nr:hypothetical protein [Candidatus Omnitrophota bacterium]